MTDPRALAMDLDGTLIDPKPRQIAILETVLGESRLEPPALERWWDAKRDGADTERALCELGFAPEPARELAAAWRARIEDPATLRLDPLLPGVVDALEALAAPPLVLTARRYADRVQEQFRALGLDRLANGLVVVDPAEAAEAKGRALREHGARAFVGDTESDAEAARLAGVAFAAVCTGQRSRAYLEALGLNVFDALGQALAALSRAPDRSDRVI